MLASLPPLVLERYQACQTVCFCGVFPEIKRAWASVDNSLFLWRFDRWCAAQQGLACAAHGSMCRTCAGAYVHVPIMSSDHRK